MFQFSQHMRRAVAMLVLAAFLLSLLLAGGALALTEKVVVIDDRGQEIVVSQPVRRVVIAGTPLYSEILVDVGATSLLVGVTDSPDNPAEVAGIPRVGSSLEPNVEEIIALDPDVVFGAVFGVRDQLEAAGLVVVTPVGYIAKIPDIFKVTRDVGKVVGRAVQAELMIGGMSEKVVEAESLVAQEERPTAAFLFASASDSPPYAVGKGSVEGEILARAGGQNLFADVDGGSVVGFEEVLERDPEFIFTDPSQVANITGNPLLAKVSAVAGGRVFGVPASALTSTRVADALYEIASKLHPQVVLAAQEE